MQGRISFINCLRQSTKFSIWWTALSVAYIFYCALYNKPTIVGANLKVRQNQTRQIYGIRPKCSSYGLVVEFPKSWQPVCLFFTFPSYAYARRMVRMDPVRPTISAGLLLAGFASFRTPFMCRKWTKWSFSLYTVRDVDWLICERIETLYFTIL